MSMSVEAYRNTAAFEHAMQATLMDYLAIQYRYELYAFAIPNAGQRSPRIGKRMKDEGMRAGVADICVMLKGGKVIWVELKTAKGRLSPAQKDFRLICRSLGHTYLLARSVSEAIDLLKAEGLR